MESLIMLGVLLTLLVGVLTIIVVYSRKGVKNAKESRSARITMHDYIAGKSELRIAELHKHYSDKGIALKGFIIYPIIN